MKFWKLEDMLAVLLKDVTEVNYVPNKGNAGDAVQALSVKLLLKKMNITVSKGGAKVTLVSGGGNLIPQYHCLRVAMSRLDRDAKVIVLPSTVVGQFPFLRTFSNLMLLARDELTWRTARMMGVPTMPCHDAAVSVDYSEWETAPDKDEYPLLKAFRSDNESRGMPLPSGNRDLSVEHHCGWWPLGGSETTARWFIDEINRYKAVETDRCHVALVAGLLGKRVTLYPNSYHKNKSVYAASLSHLPNVLFIED